MLTMEDSVKWLIHIFRYQSVENQAVKEYLIDHLIPAVNGAHSPRKIKCNVYSI